MKSAAHQIDVQAQVLDVVRVLRPDPRIADAVFDFIEPVLIAVQLPVVGVGSDLRLERF